jgi:Leucine-rich repeat (LRR) protein
MEPESKLMEAFLRFGDADQLDEQTQAALRLCNHQIKKLIDATVISCTVTSAELDLVCICDWKLKELVIEVTWGEESLRAEDTVLPDALFKKFSLLETLKVQGCLQLEALPENIGELKHLTDIKIICADKLTTFPPSFGGLTSLELYSCSALTLEGLAPLKQLKQLKILDVGGCTIEGDSSLPEWICDSITTGLLDLSLRHIRSLPSTISNFKHLTRLILEDCFISELPEAIGLLSLLQKLDITPCYDVEPAIYRRKRTGQANPSCRETLQPPDQKID